MTGLAASPMPELLGSFALAGFVFGLAYFAALQRTAALFAARRGWLLPLALTLGRIGAAVVFLAFAAKMGAASLLAAFAGFLLARAVALRALGRAS
ncbi:MAG: ATP synthase subunit I [Rhodomicrobium sp.]